jgi:hypothetical protein
MVYRMKRVTCSDECRAEERRKRHRVEEDHEDEVGEVKEEDKAMEEERKIRLRRRRGRSRAKLMSRKRKRR